MSYYDKPVIRSKYRLYVGNISHRCHPSDVEDLFADYGDLTDFDFKDRGQQVNFCFVEYRSSRDAEDAMYELNGHRLLGVPIIVEPARERRPREQQVRYSFDSGPPMHHKPRTYDRRSAGYGHRYMDNARGRFSPPPAYHVHHRRGGRMHVHHRRSRSRSYKGRVFGNRRMDGYEVQRHRHRHRHKHMVSESGERVFSEHSDGGGVNGMVHKERMAQVPDVEIVSEVVDDMAGVEDDGNVDGLKDE